MLAEAQELSVGYDDSDLDSIAHIHQLLLEWMTEIAPLLVVALFADREVGKEFYVSTVKPSLTLALGSLAKIVGGPSASAAQIELWTEAMFGVHLGLAFGSLLDGRVLNKKKVARQLAYLLGSRMPAPSRRRRIDKGRSGSAGKLSDAASSEALSANGLKRRLPKSERIAVIREAARETFVEYGFIGARTDDIASRAGITKAFMFRLFATKEELYREAIELPTERRFAQMASEIDALRARTTLSTEERLEALLAIALAAMVDYTPLCGLTLFSEIERGRKFYADSILPSIKTIRACVTEIGPWRPELNGSGIVVRVIFGAFLGTSLDHLLRDDMLQGRDITEISRQLATLFAEGLAT
jgi:AcrR family transcriptional regulator